MQYLPVGNDMTAVIKCISGLFPGKKPKKNRKKNPKPQTQNKTKKSPPHALQPTKKKCPSSAIAESQYITHTLISQSLCSMTLPFPQQQREFKTFLFPPLSLWLL